MSVVSEKGQEIFSEGRTIYSGAYRGIMELMSRFGYVSIREVMYGFNLPIQGAIDRMRYLERAKLIERFPSLTMPEYFFCLTPQGREAVRSHFIVEELHEFRPSDYSLIYQQHHRYLVKIHLALRKMLGADFKGWVSEATLKQESGKSSKSTSSNGQRVFDGEFAVTVYKTKFKQSPLGLEKGEVTEDLWRCGLELELSLKSPERYRKQFKSLSQQVYGWLDHVQRVPLVLFLYSTPTVFDRLVKHMHERDRDFGRCLFVFGQVDLFLKDLGNTPLTRFLGKENRNILASELNRINTKAAATAAAVAVVTTVAS